MARALDPASVIAGEAVSGSPQERWNDMVAIASVISNRAAALGVTPQEVIANTNEFNAYNRSLPQGVNQAHISLAQKALDYVAENGPVNNAMFYAAPTAVDSLPNGLNLEGSTTGHEFFSDPQNRAIGTSVGYITPGQFTYAQTPSTVPTPYASDSMQGGLLNAFQATPQSEDPFSAVLGGQPTFQASGIIGGTPSLDASATATPMMSVPASGILSGNAPLDAAATVSMQAPATVSERMGIAEPGFDMSRFDGVGPQVATDFDPGRFGDTVATGFDPGRFAAPTINPATNTTSFLDQPSLSVPSSGILAGNQPLEAQATVPSLASAYTAPTVTTPAEQAIDSVTTGSTTPGILSGSMISQANAPLSFTPSKGILASQPVQQSQLVSSFPTAVANNTFEPASVDGVVAAPTLDTMQVADQPAIASIDGPANTPAVEQQQTQTANNTVQAAQPQPTVQMAQNTKSFKDSLLSKETALGGILGGLIAGPPGAILGGVLGQQTAQRGGLTGLLGGGFSAPTNQIAGGIANIGGIYGGAYAPGTFAVASNGAQITAQPGGYTSYTTPSGVHEVISPTGQISHNFGSIFGGKTDEEASA